MKAIPWLSKGKKRGFVGFVLYRSDWKLKEDFQDIYRNLGISKKIWIVFGVLGRLELHHSHFFNFL